VTDLKERVENVLNRIRPALQADGADVHFIDVQDGVVTVRLTSRYESSDPDFLALRQGIERAVSSAVPDIQRIETIG
jgi:Fe-S cluster biogenesis protein NfuA